MRMFKIKVFQLFLLSLLLILFIGCSSTAPNNTEVETAIRKSLEKEVPLNSFFLVSQITIEEIDIIEIGEVQGEGTEQYWPVKVSASGYGMYKSGSDRFYNRGANSKNKFNEKFIFNISKDGFGEWNAIYDKKIN